MVFLSRLTGKGNRSAMIFGKRVWGVNGQVVYVKTANLDGVMTKNKENGNEKEKQTTEKHGCTRGDVKKMGKCL